MCHFENYLFEKNLSALSIPLNMGRSSHARKAARNLRYGNYENTQGMRNPIGFIQLKQMVDVFVDNNAFCAEMEKWVERLRLNLSDSKPWLTNH